MLNRLITVGLALGCVWVSYAHVYVSFDRVRFGVVRTDQPAALGAVSVSLPDVSDLATQPTAIVLRLRNENSSIQNILVSLDGSEIAELSLRPNRSTRIDLSLSAATPIREGSTLDFTSDTSSWTVEYVEIANVHGFSIGFFSFVIVPSSATAVERLPEWINGLVLLALLLPSVRWRRHESSKATRWVYTGLAGLVLAFFSAVLLAPLVSNYRFLFALPTFVVCVSILYLPVLGRVGRLTFRCGFRTWEVARLLDARAISWLQHARTESRLRKRVILTALLATGVLLLIAQLPNVFEGMTGSYYDNYQWSGRPVLSTHDRELSLRRADDAWYPIDYSIEWTGVVYVPATADYRFALTSDDGSYLWIDDVLVVDNGGVHTVVRQEGVTHLEKGFHRVRIRYMQRGGQARFAARWRRETADVSDEARLETAALFPQQPSLPVFAAVSLGRGVLAMRRIAAWVLVGIALLVASRLLFRRRRSRHLMQGQALLETGKKLAPYVVELALLVTTAVLLWIVLFDGVGLPRAILELAGRSLAAPTILLPVLLLTFWWLEGTWFADFRFLPLVYAQFDNWSRTLTSQRERARLWSLIRSGLGLLGILAACSLGLALTSHVQKGLTGHYYDNIDWTGDLLAIKHDRDLTLRRPVFDIINPDFLYSIEWRGTILIPEDGRYRFFLTSDGTSQLWIGINLLVENHNDERATRVSGAARLTEGIHPIRIRYAPAEPRRGVFAAEWRRGNSERRPLSSATLFPDYPGIGSLVLARLSQSALFAWKLVLITVLTLAFAAGTRHILARLRARENRLTEPVREHHVYIAALVALVILNYLAAFGGIRGYWGFSALAYIGPDRATLWLLFAGVGLLAYRSSSQRFEAVLLKTQTYLQSHPSAVLGAAAVAVLIFFGLRSEFVNSDGAMLRWIIPELAERTDSGRVNFDEMWESYLHSRFWYYSNSAFDWSVRLSYQVASSLAGGAFLVILWFYSRRLVPEHALTFCLLMVCGGYMQLFFGDVEHYSLVGVVILAYFLASASYLQGRVSLVLPSAVLALAMTFHMLAGFLLPSLAVLYAIGIRKRAFLQIALGAGAFATVIVGTLFLLNEPLSSLYQGSWGTNALRPFFTDETVATTGPGSRWAFFAFDAYHWGQYNLLARLFPAHFLILPLLVAGRIRYDLINVHLIAASLGMMFFLFNYRAMLGPGQDWNLFASSVVPLAILVWRNLLSTQNFRFRAEILISSAALSFIHSYSWITSNHHYVP